ncbi:MAG TPA: hypothetical protein QF753_13760 [Victivallales bacterium]|nr:hypothetical protein [Victivallales bacterium]
MKLMLISIFFLLSMTSITLIGGNYNKESAVKPVKSLTKTFEELKAEKTKSKGKKAPFFDLMYTTNSYRTKFKHYYGLTMDFKVMRLDLEKGEWEIIASDFGEKDLEPHKLLISPNEKYMAIIMYPFGYGDSYFIKMLNLETLKMKDIGSVQNVKGRSFSFSYDSKYFVMIGRYWGNVTKIKLE